MIEAGRIQLCQARIISEIEQSLAGQLGHDRVRVSEELHQHADPFKLAGVDADYGNSLGHSYLFFLPLPKDSSAFTSDP